ncbi:tRNA glutamyl-Q(34) synthetase GluQRS [Luteimonas sp. RIT-PG2_3]
MTYRGRFAPSPTGALHLGSLVAAFGSWLLARQAGGEWRVRIEDVDPPREVAGAAEAQLHTLAALGLHADGPVLRQSTRGDAYQASLQGLLDRGDAFVCHCSRSDLAASHGIHLRCRSGARRADPAIRLRVAAGEVVDFDDGLQGPQHQDVAREVGDVVLRRADGYWAYQLAVVVDDAAQGITDVVRGADLLDSTARQILLQRRLGLPTPRYLHLPQVVDDAGHKLSKSLAAQAIDDDAPMPALRSAWALLGQPGVLLDDARDRDALLAQAVSGFALDRVPKGPVEVFAAMHNVAVKQRV